MKKYPKKQVCLQAADGTAMYYQPMIKIYRLSYNKIPLPEEDDLEAALISDKTKQPLSVRQLFSNVKDIGKKAAKKFKQNPQKRQKLESLSPHWLRHLSASHQDLVGISGTMIQENHRHGSYSTTQIYLHVPDALRAQSMNKLHMVFHPKLYISKEENINSITQLKLSLVGSSLGGTDILTRLIAAIENNVLLEFNWKRIGDLIDNIDIIDRYEKVKIFKQPLEISYQIENIIDGEKLKYLKTAILRETEMRLFNCNLKVDYGKTSN